MSMSSGGSNGGAMSEINVTPLVDVMLVLLIIFMITAPLMSHRIKIDLPKANPNVKEEAATVPPLDVAIKEDGTYYLDDQEVSEAAMKDRLATAANLSPQPELQIRADRTSEYKVVRKLLGDAKDAGMVHVAFLTTGSGKE
jgi:biopolymer transport protein ExbD